MTRYSPMVMIAIFLVTMILCYWFAISKTINTWEKYHKYLSIQKESKELPKIHAILQQKEKYYDSLLMNYPNSGNNTHQAILKSVNDYAIENDLIVKNFYEPHVFIESGLTTTSFSVQVEGSYQDIIGLLYKLEQIDKFGEIMNVYFQKIKNHKTQKQYLQATFLISRKLPS